MLDIETKRRIDSARDILVGKVPDPKSQVEQITIALIYKFMDDMDLESEELGGERSFFKGEYEKYAWRKIFDPRMGGFEILNMYSEVIMKMNVNPNIPQLFRDIFKNAYLPYRDPETLKAFLKIIHEFNYDNSERLGDAFEYLLSILGSQGDAGQFRTPRHIIDFMVAILDPKKDEVILDPACGTAGFLISAYKHIVKLNSSNYDPETDIRTFEAKDQNLSELIINSKNFKGEKLNPDERNRLARNIMGYDISPDMVRLSLVNMYLHGLHAPRISEYDTLTSEDNWNEYGDVILANPPFMSPKGGIRPHKRFSIPSKRSEVLFVDYIADHLTPNGRAAVIIPEGIIFQSGKAYKALRKKLVENYLVGVISLPAGVFQPYSGVKTSILWMDKTLAKKTDNILFVKIDNDGFDLGAQRRPIKHNDLPKKLNETFWFKEAILGDNTNLDNSQDDLHVVSKIKIAESGDFNLTGERYKEQIQIKSDFPLITVEESLEKVNYTKKIKTSDFNKIGKYPIIDQSENYIAGYWDNKSDVFWIAKPVTIFGDHTRCFKYVDFDFVLGADGIKILQPISKFNPKFYYYLVRQVELPNLGYSRHYKELKEKKIPLPPLSVQEEIVAEIESYQKIIDGARQVVDNYKPRIDIDPEWPMVELGEVAKFIQGTQVPLGSQITEYKDGYVRFIRIVDYTQENKDIRFIKDPGVKFYCLPDEIIMVRYGASAGFVGRGIKGVFANNLFAIRLVSEKINNNYVYHYLKTELFYQQIKGFVLQAAMPALSHSIMSQIKIPVPDVNIQKKIVTHIEDEKSLIESNLKLINVFEQKIKDRIAKVWGNET